MATLTYFGKLSDITGKMTESIALPESVVNTDLLCEWLEGTYDAPGLLTDPTIRIALNDEILQTPALISDADDIAFLPPVGGG